MTPNFLINLFILFGFESYLVMSNSEPETVLNHRRSHAVARRSRVERRVLTVNVSDLDDHGDVSSSSSSGDDVTEPMSAEEVYWLSYAQYNSKPDLGRDVIVARPQCQSDSDCLGLGSACHARLGRCFCPDGYYPKDHGLTLPTDRTGNGNSHNIADDGQSPLAAPPTAFCMKAAGYGEACVSSSQCVVNVTVCTEPPSVWTSSQSETTPGGDGLKRATLGKLCLCRIGYFPGCKCRLYYV